MDTDNKYKIARERVFKIYHKHYRDGNRGVIDDYDLYYPVGYGEHFKSLPRDAKILDIGCGAGILLYWFKKEGFSSLEGCEISDSQFDVAAKKLGTGVKLHRNDFMEFSMQMTDIYSVITLFDVAEHIPKYEILEFLDRIYKILKPGGVLFLKSANAASILASIGRYVDFTHEQAFTENSLGQLLSAAGFSDIEFLDGADGFNWKGKVADRLNTAFHLLLQKFYGDTPTYKCYRANIFAVARKPED